MKEFSIPLGCPNATFVSRFNHWVLMEEISPSSHPRVLALELESAPMLNTRPMKIRNAIQNVFINFPLCFTKETNVKWRSSNKLRMALIMIQDVRATRLQYVTPCPSHQHACPGPGSSTSSSLRFPTSSFPASSLLPDFLLTG